MEELSAPEPAWYTTGASDGCSFAIVRLSTANKQPSRGARRSPQHAIIGRKRVGFRSSLNRKPAIARATAVLNYDV